MRWHCDTMLYIMIPSVTWYQVVFGYTYSVYTYIWILSHAHSFNYCLFTIHETFKKEKKHPPQDTTHFLRQLVYGFGNLHPWHRYGTNQKTCFANIVAIFWGGLNFLIKKNTCPTGSMHGTFTLHSPWKNEPNVDIYIYHTWSISRWWFQPIWKILVKLDHFPK